MNYGHHYPAPANGMGDSDLASVAKAALGQAGKVAVRGVTVFGVPMLAHLLVFALVVVLPMVSVELWTATDAPEGRWVTLTALSGSVTCIGVICALAAPSGPVSAILSWWNQAAASLEESYAAAGVSSVVAGDGWTWPSWRRWRPRSSA